MRVGYERLSKDRSLRGINVEIQREEIDEYALATGEPIGRHFCDNDTSASEFAVKPRKDYLELIALIKQDAVTEVIVTEIPRLGRQTEVAQELIRLSKATRLQYISTTDGARYDLHTPRGRKSLRDAISDAEFESDQSSARQHRKKNKQAEQGKYHGGQRAYGYEGAIRDVDEILLNPGKVGRALVPHEVAIIKECVARIIAGERQTDLVRDLNQRGITTAEGGKWRNGNLRRVLTKKKHVQWGDTEHGTRSHHGKEYEGRWPYIITAEEHSAMLAALRLKAINTKRGMIKGRQYLLSGIVRCGKCGQAMYGNGRGRENGVYQRRYVCKRHDNHGDVVGCGNVRRGADPVDLLVKQQVIYRFDSPAVAEALAPKADAAEVKELLELHTRQTVHLQSLAADYGIGLLTREELVVAKAAAQQALSNTVRALARFQAHKTAAAVPAGQTLAEVWDQASIEWKRNVILLLVDHIVIMPSHPGGQTWNGWRFDLDKVRIVWRV
ncbi:recombinase family protein [Saccharothrix sp. NPDC042600]|uniref:recombinase family protein n=1 Tax=Saccharothrix TaxID=2071 RepID=UPI0033C1FD8A|nr:recombinase family protein [Saccharothrix mutabilis subsp. capreolus]